MNNTKSEYTCMTHVLLQPPFMCGVLNTQVSSAIATFVMLFSASMSVVEYSLLGRLPRDHGMDFSTFVMLHFSFSLTNPLESGFCQEHVLSQQFRQFQVI
jgi:hypothetical protein